MPPRKVNGSPIKAAEKKPRGRQKTVKPVLKTPSVVKAKLKLPSTTTDGDENIGTTVLVEDVKEDKPITKNRKKAKTNVAPVKKIRQAKDAAKNDTGVEIHVNEVDIPNTKNNTTVKNKYVRKATTAKGAVKNDTSVESNVKEVKSPVTKNNTTVKRKNVKKATTKDVNKKNEAKGAAKNGSSVETSVIREHNPKCDISQIDANYYKILLANDVVKTQFPNASKYADDPLKEALHKRKQSTKQIVKKPTKERENKHNVKSKDKSVPAVTYDMINPTKNAGQSTKQKQLPKTVPKRYSPEKSHYKARLTSKNESKDDADNNRIVNTENTEQSTIRKHKLSLKRKTTKAGPHKEVVVCIKKGKEICKKEKPVKNGTKNQRIVTDKSIENCKFDKCSVRTEQSIRSNISWAKDISSSSSNTSFVTVDSSKCYYFDNKIPVVQLNNINETLRNNKKCSNDGGNRNADSESVVDSVTRGKLKTMSETDQQHCGSFGLNRSLSTSSNSSSSQEFNFCSEQNRINNNCSTEIEQNVADVTHSSLRLSTSSRSSSRSSSSNSSSDSASGSVSSMKNLGNRLSLEQIYDNKLGGGEKMSVSSKLKMLIQNINLNIITLPKSSFEAANNRMKAKDGHTYFRMIDILEEERIINSNVQRLIQVENDDVDKYFNHSECLKTTNTPCPKTLETHYSKESPMINEHVSRTEECIKQNNNIPQHCPPREANTGAAHEIAEKIDSNCHWNHNKSNLNAPGDNDDDDALSLFAESLTGLESCRRNSTLNSEMSNFEEYIPQLVRPTEQPRKIITYQPTKISNNIEGEILKCKKHEADSTSVLIDFSNKPNIQENNIYADKAGNCSQNLPTSPNIVTKNTPVANKPRLMALYYEPVQRIRSAILKGYCVFNTVSKCKNVRCKYPHEYPIVNDVKNTLQRLSENSFIQEYMLMRDSPQLRRKYGLCFVEECIRRELTRILVEIAIDFIVKTSKQSLEDNVLKSEVVDTVLMYLNRVDLSICDDLLNFNLKNGSADRVLLCDYFMSVIATSQNFSRFKSVFIKLTDLMYRNERKFSVDVAESILERFCILPYDDILARALLIILKNTDVTIFSNTKIDDLEKQLVASNGDLYHELKSIKEQALVSQAVLDNHRERTHKPLQSLEMDKMNTNNVGHMDKRYSPDTTDLGHANKPAIKIQKNITTVFNRTVNIDKLQNLGVHNNTTMQNKFGTQIVNNASFKWGNPSTFIIGENAKMNLCNTTEDGRKTWQWKNRSIFDAHSNRNHKGPMWPQKAPFKRHSNRNFEGSPTKIKRYSFSSQYQSDLS